ncbi:MAG: guanylate kinase [Tepidiformaceae bacterium]
MNKRDGADEPRRKPVVVVLHGPAGVGKDSVIGLLRQRSPIHRATSSTTRQPRAGEVPGVDYHFLSVDDFEAGIAAGQFIEWARVYDDLKGVHVSEVTGPMDAGQDLIIRTDVQGARTWRQKLEGAVFVFLMAEDREVLRERLIHRGSETASSLERRLAEIDEEIDDMPNNDYVVYNHKDALDQAVEDLEAIIEQERENPARPAPRLREGAATGHN